MQSIAFIMVMLRYNAERAIYNGRRIFGYIGEKNKHYEINTVTASIVRGVFRDFVAGVPLQKICDDLNSDGIRTNNKKFTKALLRSMLKNRAYIGEYRWKDIVVADGIPALVDEDTFNAAQAMFN